ncbi:MAG TPA: hypothetical protein VF841_16805 [Anaeromyxobacter sp.]
MGNTRRAAIRYLVSLALLGASSARADGPVVLKLGTLAPQGSAWHELLKEMGERWSSASGGAVRATLGAIAREAGRKADAEVRRMNAAALAAMERRGLSIVPVDPVPWRAAIEKGYGLLRGDVVPAPFFDAIAAARDACRASHPG